MGTEGSGLRVERGGEEERKKEVLRAPRRVGLSPRDLWEAASSSVEGSHPPSSLMPTHPGRKGGVGVTFLHRGLGGCAPSDAAVTTLSGACGLQGRCAPSRARGAAPRLPAAAPTPLAPLRAEPESRGSAACLQCPHAWRLATRHLSALSSPGLCAERMRGALGSIARSADKEEEKAGARAGGGR